MPRAAPFTRKQTMIRLLQILLVAFAPAPPAQGAQPDADSPNGLFFMGSPAVVAANLVLAGRSATPNFYRIIAGCWLTERHAVSVESMTWRDVAPAGVPYGPSFDSLQEGCPGQVKEAGPGTAYRRLLKGNFYSAVYVRLLATRYVDQEDRTIRDGFRRSVPTRAGYRMQLFQDHVALDPSIATSVGPIDTHIPARFAPKERNRPNFFRFEPGLHFAPRV